MYDNSNILSPQTDTSRSHKDKTYKVQGLHTATVTAKWSV